MTNRTSSKKFSWRTAVVISLSAGLLTAAFSIFIQTHTTVVSAFAVETPLLRAEAPSTTTSLGTSYEIPGQPVRLIIPSIKVDAKIESTGLSWRGTGAMGVPTNFTNVAWYKDGPRPGEPGSAVIDGHLDGKNVKEAVFYDLGKLQPGDAVDVVDANGKTLHFRVTETKTYDASAPTAEIFAADTSKARLNLITCAGDWNRSQNMYTKRVVVFTELITTN